MFFDDTVVFFTAANLGVQGSAIVKIKREVTIDRMVSTFLFLCRSRLNSNTGAIDCPESILTQHFWFFPFETEKKMFEIPIRNQIQIKPSVLFGAAGILTLGLCYLSPVIIRVSDLPLARAAVGSSPFSPVNPALQTINLWKQK